MKHAVQTPADAAFDARLRARHEDALAHLSPRVQAQLALRRQQALRGAARTVPPARHRWALVGSGVAAIAVLGVGLHLRDAAPGPAPAGPPATRSALQVADAPTVTSGPAPMEGAGATTRPASPQPVARSGGAALDLDPDFYAWLGSVDAPQLAME